MASATGKIIQISIAGIIFAYIGAQALTAIGEIDTAGMDAGTAAMLGIVGVVFVIGVVLLFLKESGINVN